MSDKHPDIDRNFDDLSQRFQRQIYDSMKGRLRLSVLRRDFAEYLPPAPLRILDIGAGQGQWALEMLAAGHSVYLTDISQNMLDAARQKISESELPDTVKQQARWLQCGVQELAGTINETFDLVVCHAVMEWLEQPYQLLRWIEPLMAQSTWFSLIFYNRDGLIFKNLLRANYSKVESRDFRGHRGSLTPINPLGVDEVLAWLEAANFELICRSGIRVFHDYVLDKNNYQKDPDSVERLELAYSRVPPFRDLGRYQHFLLRKK